MSDEAEALDPMAVLIDAWVAWDKAAAALSGTWPTAATLEREAKAKEAAITALGLDSIRLHELVAAERQRAVAGHDEGLSIPDAVQAAVNELLPTPPATIDLPEAS